MSGTSVHHSTRIVIDDRNIHNTISLPVTNITIADVTVVRPAGTTTGTLAPVMITAVVTTVRLVVDTVGLLVPGIITVANLPAQCADKMDGFV